MEKIIKFDKSCNKQILDIFDKKLDEEGYIVEKNTGDKVLTRDGEEIKIGEFAGIKKGSEIFIKSKITSLIEFANKE